jgi:hypothetical protein
MATSTGFASPPCAVPDRSTGGGEASAAVSSTARAAGGHASGAASRSRNSLPAVQIRTTVIRPVVSVRVLSVQTIVADPSDSTAGSRRTSACRRTIRRMPTASAMVATAGRASGMAATARAMPVSSTVSQGAPLTAAAAATTPDIAIVSQASLRPSASSRRSSGVGSSSIALTSVPMRPSSVRVPVATTTASPVPLATVVPRYAMLARSATSVSTGSGATCLSAGIDSPVKGASSVLRSMASSSRTSAGTRLPASSRTMSPATRVSAATASSRPLRFTSACEASSCSSASIARRARHSVVNPSTALITSTVAMAAASSRSPMRSDRAVAAISSPTTTLRS